MNPYSHYLPIILLKWLKDAWNEWRVCFRYKETRYFILGLSASAGALTYSFCQLILSTEFATVSKINYFIAFDTLLAVIAVLLFNSQSIIVANKARKDAPKGKTHCEYCGEPNAKIVCGKCHSVLYYQISSAWKIANVFFAHHRWQMITVLFAVLLVIPFSGAYQLRSSLAAQAEGYERETQVVIAAANTWRNSLMQMSNAYPDSIPASLGSAFLDNYFIFSWSVPRLFDYYRMHRCSATDFGPNTMAYVKKRIDCKLNYRNADKTSCAADSTIHKELKEHLHEMGCLWTQERFFPNLDTAVKDSAPVTIVDYLDYNSKRLSKELRIGRNATGLMASDTTEFKRAVNCLFFVGKMAVATLESLAFGPNQGNGLVYSSTANEDLLKFITQDKLDTLF